MENSVRYLKLTDVENKGDVVKQVGRNFYGYVNGNWERRGISIGYFLPEAPEFECYEEITETEAFKILNIVTE